MEKMDVKNVEIHLSEKVQANLIEALRHLKARGDITPEQLVKLQQVAADKKDAKGQNTAENKADAKKAAPKNLGDSQNSKVVREADQAKVYEKLVQKGNRPSDQNQEQKLMAILNEVEHGENIRAAMHSPAPVPSNEFDEKFLAKLEEELEFDEEEHGEEGDDEDGDDDASDDGDDLSMKDTDPGYFKSLLVKI